MEQDYGIPNVFVLDLYYAHVVVFWVVGIIPQVGFGWLPGMVARIPVASIADRIQIKVQRSFWRKYSCVLEMRIAMLWYVFDLKAKILIHFQDK